MITHIVCFKLKDRSAESSEDKRCSAEHARQN